MKQGSADDAAFIMFRISDVYMTHLHDFGAARDMLEQVIGNFPNTRHSANAHHKITEIEQAEFAYLQSQRAKAAISRANLLRATGSACKVGGNTLSATNRCKLRCRAL